MDDQNMEEFKRQIDHVIYEVVHGNSNKLFDRLADRVVDICDSDDDMDLSLVGAEIIGAMGELIDEYCKLTCRSIRVKVNSAYVKSIQMAGDGKKSTGIDHDSSLETFFYVFHDIFRDSSSALREKDNNDSGGEVVDPDNPFND